MKLLAAIPNVFLLPTFAAGPQSGGSLEHVGINATVSQTETNVPKHARNLMKSVTNRWPRWNPPQGDSYSRPTQWESVCRKRSNYRLMFYFLVLSLYFSMITFLRCAFCTR